MGKRHADTDQQYDTPQKRFRNNDQQDETPPAVDQQDFVLTRELVESTILTDMCGKKWRIGKAIGKGSFGEIFLASDEITKTVRSDNAKYVVKIEPHSNGPLFVEIHCLLNTAKRNDNEPLPPGMPEYIASGSHMFKNTKYRFLILQRFRCDLHSIVKNRRIDQKNLLTIAGQIIDVLEHLHDKGYAHSDIKAENLMIGKCTYRKKLSDEDDDKENVDEDEEDSGDEVDDDEEEEEEDEEDGDEKGDEEDDEEDEGIKSEEEEEGEEDEDEDEEEEKEDDDEDYEADVGTDEVDSNAFVTPVQRRPKRNTNIEYSGSNPVRSCRMSIRKNSMYEEMLSSHYLRPSKKINYCDDDDDPETVVKDDDKDAEWVCRKSQSPNKSATKHVNFKLEEQEEEEDEDEKPQYKLVTEDRIFLIDFGLASKFIDSSGNHRPFCMDQRRAHDGTLEYTSRDAHMGAHSRRSDLECFGYNLIYWSEGMLPWKNEKLLTQPEQVHRMKEYFMTDVKEMLKHIYGKGVPKYLGDFMNYVCKLAYHDRPDYAYCRNLFKNELKKLGHNATDCVIDLNELSRKPLKFKEKEMENFNGKINVKSMMKLGLLIPFRENGTNRISPKNLRSKSDKIPKKQRKKFSWTEILSTDPDQIARQRAEKEYERDSADTPILSKYKGKPTYAILEVENRIKFKERLEFIKEEPDKLDDRTPIKGYTKPMMDILRKKLADTPAAGQQRRGPKTHNNSMSNFSDNHQQFRDSFPSIDSKACSRNSLNNSNVSQQQQQQRRSDYRLRTSIKQTERAHLYREKVDVKKQRQRNLSGSANSEYSPTDESSCSSNNSNDATILHSRSSSKSTATTASTNSMQSSTTAAQRYRSCQTMTTSSDEDSHDTTDYSPIKTRRIRKTTNNSKSTPAKSGGKKNVVKATKRTRDESAAAKRLSLRAFTPRG